MNIKKVLIVTYYWPPYGGTGTYRILKFVKNLRAFGYEPIILTTKNPDAPIYDKNLLGEVPEEIKIFRTSKFELTTFFRKKISKQKGQIATNVFQSKPKGFFSRLAKWIRVNLFIPDAKIGWYSFAVSAGKKIILDEKPDLIFSTSPPPTTQLIARKLSKWSGLKWVADFRDPWTKIFYLDEANQFSLSRKRNERLEKRVLRDCNAFTAVNDGFFPHLDFRNKMTVIPNGFDASEFVTALPETRNEKFTIRYLGGWKSNQQVKGLTESLKEISKDKKMSESIRLETFGFIDSEIKKEFKSDEIKIEVNHYDYADRPTTIRKLQTSDLLIMIIGKSKLQDQGLSTKIFEYMCTYKPIIGFGPVVGSAAKILSETGCGKMFSLDDVSGCHEFIMRCYNDWLAGQNFSGIRMDKITKYDFRFLTSKLADTFNRVLAE